MIAIAHRAQRWTWKKSRRWLVALEGVIAVNAVGGGVYGLTGAKDVPLEWLEGSPFDSYLIPSLVLLILVGGSMAVACALLVAGHRRAIEASIVAACILLGWLAVEITIIPFSWLQPVFALLGLLLLALAVSQRRLGRPVV
jgi:hypothetical protein